ncbi:hypothetical protein ACFSKU_09945 [Pontibacter silvestris]|uniref:DUF3999 domain-containing protein n=1 Tax=Pontibacter silvestris TaxID=2305183 RepID=A0ABW4WX06_9BACT|nr:hypothetical protein [Pontibacter silvestris]
MAFTLLCHGITAQNYRWQANIEQPQQAGYYNILLPPQVVGQLQPGKADVRLQNSKGTEVPYLLRVEEPLQYKKLFTSHQIISYTHREGCCSELLIANPEKRKINNMSLLVSNAEVQKEVNLSGSNNQQDWYVLKEKGVLFAINSTQSTSEVRLLNFPWSNYKYLRLQLNDSSCAPLNILQVGSYDTQAEAGKYTQIPVQQVIRTDSSSLKQTYVRLLFEQPVYPDRLELQILEPQLYYRTGLVILGKEKVIERRRKRKRNKVLRAATIPFVLSSNAPDVIDLPRRKVQELTFIIENEDNPPLQINSIKLLQLNHYLAAELNPAQQYSLRFGNEKAKSPNYELQYFQDSIPQHLPVLQVKHIEQVQTQTASDTKTPNLYVWIAIIIVASALIFMSMRLLNDMSKKKSL